MYGFLQLFHHNCFLTKPNLLSHHSPNLSNLLTNLFTPNISILWQSNWIYYLFLGQGRGVRYLYYSLYLFYFVLLVCIPKNSLLFSMQGGALEVCVCGLWWWWWQFDNENPTFLIIILERKKIFCGSFKYVYVLLGASFVRSWRESWFFFQRNLLVHP